jgi:hypothetical protein
MRKAGRGMQPSSQLVVHEKYISEWALPNEPIASWIRWNDDAPVEKILLKYEADIFIPRFINTDGRVFEQDINSGEIVIPKEYLQVPGFFGFQAIYTVLPQDERPLEFIVEIHQDQNEIHVERLLAQVVRPILQLSAYPANVILEDSALFRGVIDMQVTNSGSVHAREARITFDVHSTADLKVIVKNDTIKDTRRDNIRKEVLMNSMIIKGKGKALIRMNIEYIDNRGNTYRNALSTLTLDVRHLTNEEILFNGLRPRDEFPLLLAE